MERKISEVASGLPQLTQLAADEWTFETRGRGTSDLTPRLKSLLESHPCETGTLTIFLRHTSASLIICENADPEVRRDLERFAARFCPDGDPIFRHVDEGPDDMPAHIRAIFTQTSLQIPVWQGRLGLGTWQGVYLWEHRLHAHSRRLLVSLVGCTPS